MPRRTLQYTRVGLFVAGALAVLVATVFVIGQEHSLFTPRTRLHTNFPNVSGLVVGAPVRLAGVDVGRVTAVRFSHDLQRPEAHVELEVEDRYMGRVRRDSRAYIDTKGLLGDKIINLTVGTPSEPQLTEDAYIESGKGTSFEAVTEELEDTVKEAREAVQRLASPELADNLRRVTGALASLLEEVEHGDGLAHALLYEPAPAEHTNVLLSNLADASRQMRSASGRLDRILSQVETGPGAVHGLVYDPQGEAALAEWQRAGRGLADLMEQVNHGDGLAAALLRDEAGREVVTDLAEVARRLNRISAEVERGRGTLGGLLVDPTLYEDMKSILGNIERNVILKALIRWTIKEDDWQRPALPAERVGEP